MKFLLLMALIFSTVYSTVSLAYLRDSDDMNRIGTESTFYVTRDIVFTNSKWEVYIQEGVILNRFADVDQEKMFCVINSKDQQPFARKIPRGRRFGIKRASSMGGGYLFSVNFTLIDRDIDMLNCNRWYVYEWPTIGELRSALGSLIQLRLGNPHILNQDMAIFE